MKRKLLTSIIAGTCMCAMAVTGCAKESEDISSSDTNIFAEYDYDVAEYVTLGQYKGFNIELEDDYTVSDDDVIETIETQLASFPYYEKISKDTVEEDDFVNLTYEGTINGEVSEYASGEDVDLQIGSAAYDYFTEENGFEEGLIGKKVGDKVQLKLTFADDYADSELAGQDVTFKVTINQIEEQKYYSYDELNDEIVSDIFGYESLESYFEYEKDELTESALETKEATIKSEIFELLGENNSADVPDELIEQRVEEYVAQYEEMCDENSTTLSEYLDLYYGMTEDEFRENVTTYMEESLSEEFILQAIADKEGITFDEDGFNAYMEEVVADYGYEDVDEVIDTFGESYVKKDYLLFKKTYDYILNSSTVTYVEAETESDSISE